MRGVACATVIGAIAMGAVDKPGAAPKKRIGSEVVGPEASAPERQPESARRFVRVFDFEDKGNPYPVPPGWLRAQEDPALVPDANGRVNAEGVVERKMRLARPGFPPHNEAAYDFGTAATGRASIRVPVKGGSASLRLQPGELPIFADADYAITARVKTKGLQNARAYLTARLLDGSLRPIAESGARSVALWDGNAADWTNATVELPAKFGAAAWMQIDLEVLQPKQWRAPGVLGTHEVWEEDLDGAAWFDDVLVYLQPRASLRTLQVCNVGMGVDRAGADTIQPTSTDVNWIGSSADGQPVIEASVRDLGGDALTADVRVWDHEMREVARTTFAVDPTGLPQRWIPALPGYGVYTAVLEVRSDADLTRAGKRETGVTVATSTLPIAWLPKRQVMGELAAVDLQRFGVIADEEGARDIGLIGRAVKRLGTKFVMLPMFGADAQREHAKEELTTRAAAIGELLAEGQELTFGFERPPTELVQVAVLDPGDPLAMFTRPTAEWFGYLQPTLDRFGQQVRRYQVGVPGTERLMWADDLSGALTALETQLATLVPGPRMGVSWRADQQRPMVARLEEPAVVPASATIPASVNVGGHEIKRTAMRRQTGPLVDAVTLWYPHGFSADEMGAVLKEWNTPDAIGEYPEITVALDLPGAGEASQHERIRELARRVIGVWATLPAHGRDGENPTRIAIRTPWAETDDRRGGLVPAPEWAVFANLGSQLAGRRIVGTYPAEPGVTCLILAEVDPRSGEMSRGALVAWRNGEAMPPSGAERKLKSIGRAEKSAGAVADGVNNGWMAADRTGTNERPSELDVRALGDGVRVVDVFGNERVVSEAGLMLSDLPVFVEGVNPYVATFMAGMRLEPEFVESVAAEHESQVLLTNPWPIRITGSIQIRETDADRARVLRSNAWNITPAGIVDFAIGPGETLKLPISFTFGPSQLAGYKRLTILSRVTADREYPLLKLDTTMEVGLEDFRMDLEVQRLPNASGPDVVVTASVTNLSARSRSMRLEAATAKLPTQQLQISDLGPNQTIIKRFVFKGSGAAMAGRNVIVSLADLEEAKRLNKAVVVP